MIPVPRGLVARTTTIDGEVYLVLSHPQKPTGSLELLVLTPAERDVARRLLAGHTHAAIARARGTSTRTVANQIARIYSKAGVGSREELARRADGPTLSRHADRATPRARPVT